MKRLLLLITICISSVSFGQSCFSDKSDVMTYTIYKTFESEDGTIKITFGPSEATMYAGSSKYRYMYENWSYMGSGYKGSVTMMELSGGGGLKLFISCRERMMTDNQGTLLYEEGTTGASSSSLEEDIPSIEIGNTFKVGPTYKTRGLEVMEADLGPMSWSEAIRLNDKVNGWRVPDKDELMAICEAGNLKNDQYWTSAKDESIDYDSWGFYVYGANCNLQSYRTSESYKVKLVKPFGDKVKQEVDGENIRIDKLVFKDITQLANDRSVYYRGDLDKFVESLGKEWRLPNTKELTVINENLSLFNPSDYSSILGSSEHYDDLNRVTRYEELKIKNGQGEIEKYGRFKTKDDYSTITSDQLVIVRDLTSKEIEEEERLLKIKMEKENEVRRKAEEEERAKQAELASKMKNQGKNDSKTYYKGWIKSGVISNSLITLATSPLGGIISTVLIAKKQPKMKNLNAPSEELMNDSNYKREYIKTAHKTKKRNVWISYAASSILWIGILLL